MAQFFRSVWAGSDDALFGVVDAVKFLRERNLAMIIGWLGDPFFRDMDCNPSPA